MNLKISKNWLIYIILIFAFANATLRITESGATTLYRIAAIPFFLYIMIKKWDKSKKYLMYYACINLYSIAVSFVFYRHISYDMYIFLFFNFVELLLFLYLYEKDDSDSCELMWSFLDKACVCTLFLCLIQVIFKIHFPYTLNLNAPEVNAYFWNGNELVAALAFVAIVYAYRFLFLLKKMDGVKVLIIILIAYVDDAKLSLIGISISVFLMLSFKILLKSKSKKHLSGKLIGAIIILLLCLSVAIMASLNIVVTFRDYSINFNDLIGDAIKSIFRGETFNSAGSIYDRTDAIIFGLREYKNTWGFGMGLGTANYILTWSQYHLATAESMHNFVVQFLCEFGWIAVYVYYKVAKAAVRSTKSIFNNHVNVLFVAFPVSFIFISSQSSVGIFSNYFFWAVPIYIYFIAKRNLGKNHYNKEKNDRSVQK